MRPEALFSISKTIRPGVAETTSFCLRGIPAALRNSRESTILLDASSSTVVFMALVWRGRGVFASCRAIKATEQETDWI
jgi:glycerol kinase